MKTQVEIIGKKAEPELKTASQIVENEGFWKPRGHEDERVIIKETGHGWMRLWVNMETGEVENFNKKLWPNAKFEQIRGEKITLNFESD